MNKTQSNRSFINYEHFAKTYLLMAKVGMLARDGAIDKVRLDADDEWRLEEGLVMIPVTYCIRHSIELFLKSIDIGINNKYLLTHDLTELSKALSLIRIPPDSLHKINNLIEKYSSYNFSEELIENFSENQSKKNFDLMNEIFRFPEKKVDTMTVRGENLRLLKTAEGLQDIADIKSIFDQISTIRQLTNSGFK